ncbi:MAG: tripartite tricarboxylate transporter substrate binding protein [Roseomonas sp.]|nr:tripartite tricarboxylate transporter substrate binding protein [Roseomonas sp.]MCA3326154.1 tripartite tricarboxylate transporter substrate binding protein [Roseomonas sp.]MCA3330260.1 tripartite tricarboxylate transporter substrate binding protein [Roseomonas sp.]MCA3335290.1 tripartite tricarboxylate transporter substrate binding protein [Roseomonas sp.]MCA3348667.1 tripartite tricarboxylate transporter substrate binding protein [Roseomonas sp.]
MRRRHLLAALPAAALAPRLASAQEWPPGPVRAIVPFAPGSATDTVARVFTEKMRETLGQNVVVENRAGANGLIGAEAVARATPDGLTVLIGTNSTNAAAGALFKRVPFDVENAFIPVSTLGSVPLLVAVRAESRWQNLAELLAEAKTKPEGITYASASSSQQVSTELMAHMAGVKMLRVPYRSSPLAVQDLLAGRVDFFVADQLVILPQAREGKLRILGITAPQRSAMLPEIPTVAEAGNLPGYQITAWFGLFVPAGTPAIAVSRLNAAVRRAGEQADLRERLSSGFGMVVATSTPEEAAAFVKSETQRWTSAIRTAGIEPE